VAEARVPPHLAVGAHVQPRLLLEPDRLVHGAIVDLLELGGADRARFPALARRFQVLRP